MAVDPQIQTLIDGMSAGPLPHFSELGHEAVREMCESMLLPFEAGELEEVKDQQIAVNNTELTVRLYQPKRTQRNQTLPVLVYFHGGGWSIGSLNTHDPICRALCSWGECVVVSVDYRLSPEHPFPTPLEDCYAACQWIYENANTLQADPKRLIVAGDSAGGNLAASVCLLNRERQNFSIVYQLLFYPITNADFNTESYIENAEGYVLRKTDMQWFWDQYIPQTPARTHPLASPLQAELHNLPPATIITAQYDTLRDEGRLYAEKLKDAGVTVNYQEVPGMIHGFIGFAAICDTGKDVLKDCAEKLEG